MKYAHIEKRRRTKATPKTHFFIFWCRVEAERRQLHFGFGPDEAPGYWAHPAGDAHLRLGPRQTPVARRDWDHRAQQSQRQNTECHWEGDAGNTGEIRSPCFLHQGDYDWILWIIFEGFRKKFRKHFFSLNWFSQLCFQANEIFSLFVFLYNWQYSVSLSNMIPCQRNLLCVNCHIAPNCNPDLIQFDLTV